MAAKVLFLYPCDTHSNTTSLLLDLLDAFIVLEYFGLLLNFALS